MYGKQGGTSSRPPNPPPSSNTTPQSPRLYLSYLLRLWSNSGVGERGIWRAALESPLTQEQQHFPDLESLFAFLRTMTGPELAVDEEPATDVIGDGGDIGDMESGS